MNNGGRIFRCSAFSQRPTSSEAEEATSKMSETNLCSNNGNDVSVRFLALFADLSGDLRALVAVDPTQPVQAKLAG